MTGNEYLEYLTLNKSGTKKAESYLPKEFVQFDCATGNWGKIKKKENYC